MLDRMDPALLPFIDSESRWLLQGGQLSVEDHQALLAEAKKKREAWESTLEPNREQLLAFTHAENQQHAASSSADEQFWKGLDRDWRAAQQPTDHPSYPINSQSPEPQPEPQPPLEAQQPSERKTKMSKGVELSDLTRAFEAEENPDRLKPDLSSGNLLVPRMGERMAEDEKRLSEKLADLGHSLKPPTPEPPSWGGFHEDPKTEGTNIRHHPPNILDVLNALSNSEAIEFWKPRDAQQEAQKPTPVKEEKIRELGEEWRAAEPVPEVVHEIGTLGEGQQSSADLPDGTLPKRTLNRFWLFRKLMEHPRWSGGGGLVLSFIIATKALDYEIDGAVKTAAFVFLLAWATLSLATYVSIIWDKSRPGSTLLLVLVAVGLFGVWRAYLPPPPAPTTPESSAPIATPSQGPTVHPALKPLTTAPLTEVRTFVEVEPNYLVGLYKTYNSAQADEIVKHHIGKWLKISGLVSDVRRDTNAKSQKIAQMALAINRSDGWTLYAIIADFDEQRWIDRALVIRPNEKVTVIGRIERVSPPGIFLSNCEIVE